MGTELYVRAELQSGVGVTDEEYRSFYRIVRASRATLDDFVSNAARGRPKPSDPRDAYVWDGLSVYNTAAQARRKRRESPVLGNFIAVLRVPLDGSVRVERTRGAGHHTLWANPDALLSLVVAVEPA